MLTALLDVQNNPEGEFQRLLRGMCFEKWLEKGSNEDSSGKGEDGNVTGGDGEGMKRGPSAVSSEADGSKAKKKREDDPKAVVAGAASNVTEELSTLKAQIESLGERVMHLEMTDRHKDAMIEELTKAKKAQEAINKKQEETNQLLSLIAKNHADDATAKDAKIEALEVSDNELFEQIRELIFRATRKGHQVKAIVARLDGHDSKSKEQNRFDGRMIDRVKRVESHTAEDNERIRELRKENKELVAEVKELDRRQGEQATLVGKVKKVVGEIKKEMKGGELTTLISLDEEVLEQVVAKVLEKLREDS
jgi:chromosome segregation ATPase